MRKLRWGGGQKKECRVRDRPVKAVGGYMGKKMKKEWNERLREKIEIRKVTERRSESYSLYKYRKLSKMIAQIKAEEMLL